MKSALVALLLTTITGQVTTPPDDAFLLLGQSTCLGYDAQGGASNGNSTLGNLRPRNEIYYRFAGQVFGAGYPFELLTDEVNCGFGKGVNASVCGEGNAGYNGPRRGVQDHWKALTGRTSIGLITAGAGIPLAPYWDPIPTGTMTQALRASLEMWAVRSATPSTPRGRPVYVITCQGEADANNSYASYYNGVQAWQATVQSEVQRAMGHKNPVPMFAMQYGSCSAVAGGYQTVDGCGSMQSLVDAAKGPARGKVIITGPAYPYIHNSVHPTGFGACAYSGNEQRGAATVDAVNYWRTTGNLPTVWWENAERLDATTIRLTFNVPTPPLVFDTSEQYPGIPATEMTEPTYFSGGGKKGFHVRKYYGDFTFPAVTAVDICTGSGTPHAACQQNGTQIIVTHTSESGIIRVYYAGITATVSANPGPATGMRGNVRDSSGTLYTPDRACGTQMLRRWAISEYKEFPALP